MIKTMTVLPQLTGIHANDKRTVCTWAKQVCAEGFILIDSETTGLEYDSEVIQLALLSSNGEVLLDELIKPRTEIDETGMAFKANGITNERVAQAALFETVWEKAVSLIHEQHIIIYNKDFDTRLICQSLQYQRTNTREFQMRFGCTVDCAMEAYAAFVGVRRGLGEYRWQKLPGGDHSALGDCRSTLELLEKMAAYAN